MKKILLKSGNYAVVDDKDYELVNSYKWAENKGKDTSYAVCMIPKSKLISMHRLIMGVTDKKLVVDHKDGNGLNNCRSNLRACTHAQNLCNRKPKDNGTSKYLGVYYDKSRKSYKKWAVELRKNREKIKLGFYENEVDAARAYNVGAMFYHGEFARLNDV